jgi:hypothetical protein
MQRLNLPLSNYRLLSYEPYERCSLDIPCQRAHENIKLIRIHTGTVVLSVWVLSLKIKHWTKLRNRDIALFFTTRFSVHYVKLFWNAEMKCPVNFVTFGLLNFLALLHCTSSDIKMLWILHYSQNSNSVYHSQHNSVNIHTCSITNRDNFCSPICLSHRQNVKQGDNVTTEFLQNLTVSTSTNQNVKNKGALWINRCPI